ncbi:MAG: class I SAM-dependent methyltransferase [Micropruina sp.]|nr:class I SAM-dependent methyltransferase [Micropruina sp.]
MDADDARWLVSSQAAGELAALAAEPDPGALGVAERLRRRLSVSRAAAVSAQALLRRRARTKFGARADSLFFTTAGLEQASRSPVAAWRAQRLAEAGVRRVADLGCGIGADALAFAAAGLDVFAVEADEVTAILAAANLGHDVLLGDATAVLDTVPPDAAVFCDPARRTSEGRSWRVEDLSPPWSFVGEVLRTRTACIKLAPGMPHALIPDGVAATWVSERGDLVELSLWRGEWPAQRQAVLLPSGAVLSGPLNSSAGNSGSVDSGSGDPSTGPTRGTARLPVAGEVLYEPDAAVIRAALVDRLAADLDAVRVQPGIAYLLGRTARPTPFATAFEVLAVLDASERTLRSWVRSERIGTLEIKKRGIDVDPAALRRRLKPAGPASATVVLTPTQQGARALVVRRLG